MNATNLTKTLNEAIASSVNSGDLLAAPINQEQFVASLVGLFTTEEAHALQKNSELAKHDAIVASLPPIPGTLIGKPL